MEIIKSVVILIIFFILSFILVVSLGLCLVSDKPKIHTHIKKYKFKVGDIMVWGNPGIIGSCISGFSLSSWTHPAMIYSGSGTKPEDMHVIDLTPKGLRKMKLSEWIRRAGGNRFGVIPYIGPKPFPEQRLIEEIENLEGKVTYEKLGPRWIKYFGPLEHDDPESVSSEMVCSEYINHLLQRIGVQKKIWTPASFCPGDIASRRFPVEDGHNYGECMGFC